MSPCERGWIRELLPEMLILLVLTLWTAPLQAQDRSYPEMQASLEVQQRELARRFGEAADEVSRNSLRTEAAILLRAAVADSLGPFWLGTSWDFNGTTQVPGEGMIACGYFVTTLLRDAGVDLARVRLAQASSETMIKELVAASSIRRFSDAPLSEFLAAVAEWGEGLYIVGLDCHTGFIVHEAEGTRFLHSSYLPPRMVLEEEAAGSGILGASRYRVLGKLTGDRGFLERWLDRGADSD
jgi:hypothetical protein